MGLNALLPGAVVGGDVSQAPVLTLSVAITGHMSHGAAPVLRSGGRNGDLLVVTLDPPDQAQAALAPFFSRLKRARAKVAAVAKGAR